MCGATAVPVRGGGSPVIGEAPGEAGGQDDAGSPHLSVCCRSAYPKYSIDAWFTS